MNQPIVAVLGAGRMARAALGIFQKSACTLRCWARREEARTAVNAAFPGVHVGATVTEVCSQANLIVMAVPRMAFDAVAKQLGEVATGDMIVLHATRGIGADLELPDAVIRRHTCLRKIGVLGGPLFIPDDISKGAVLAVLASRFDECREQLALLVHNAPIMLHPSSDVTGVQVASSVSNVATLAAGIAEGAGLSDTQRGALMLRGIADATRLGLAMGAHAATFSGLAAMSDLIPRHVHNTALHDDIGRLIGKGLSVEEALDKTATSLDAMDALATVRHVVAGAERLDLDPWRDLSLIAAVEAICHQGMPARATLESLLRRDFKLGMQGPAVAYD